MKVSSVLPASLEKCHLQPDKVKTIKKNPTKEEYLKKDHILLVYMVSAYNYILRDPGRLYHTKGKSDTYDILSGGCVFIDHVSGYIRIKHQGDSNSTETVKLERTFEREAQSQGVAIKG